jgi:signal transduction histidine kinase
MCKKIEFKVAAKTARLIGRESISSAEGAIIELVKNSYDADAKSCAIYITSKYHDIPHRLSASEYSNIQNDFPNSNLVTCYEKDPFDDTYELLENLNDQLLEELSIIFSSYNSIIIADNGEGMTSTIIENEWMTIGTNSKEISALSTDGRVRSGAKGIGRFALDKLGHECKMYAKSEDKTSCIWSVNWDDFEGRSTLNEVTASLSSEDFSFKQILKEITRKDYDLYNDNANTGVLIYIQRLREFWPKNRILKLFGNLKSLLPPSEETDFKISLYSNQFPDDFGELSNADYEEYDWKLIAKVRDGLVKMEFYPSEYDLANFNKNFFDNELYLQEPLFTKDDFFKGKYTKEIEVKNLIPSSSNANEVIRSLNELGDLDFSVYFLKRGQSSDDSEKYNYRSFNQASRKKWFEQNGGVKIYRDKMRVRPYGVGSHFDWLKLDKRAAESPAAPSRKGQWRVRAHQLAGVAHVSRLDNPTILDQSNREGLIENRSLTIFQNVLTALIKEFEYQRSFVASVLDDLFKKSNLDAQVVEQSDEIIRGHSNNSAPAIDLLSKPEEEGKIDVLVKRAKLQNEKIDVLTEQNKILRVLASSGAMISSFAHDFKKVSNTLLSRHSDLVQLLEMHDLDVEGLDEALNPFVMIKDMEKQDRKLNAWLILTLDTLKQDRRKSKKVIFKNYFSSLRSFWATHLAYRNAELNFLVDDNVALKCFEIELDSIFNNLISNSYEAFKRPKFRGDKRILITVTASSKGVECLYEDTGPGLLDSIENPMKIFEPLFTTKTDSDGNSTGTGLGMSLIKGSIDDLKGSINIVSKAGESGFKLKFTIPQYKSIME